MEDALNATKAAVEEGIVAGGGSTLLKLAQKVTVVLHQQCLQGAQLTNPLLLHEDNDVLIHCLYWGVSLSTAICIYIYIYIHTYGWIHICVCFRNCE